MRRLVVLWLVTSLVLVLIVPGAWDVVSFFGWQIWSPPRSDGSGYGLIADSWAFLPLVWIVVGALALIAMGLLRRGSSEVDVAKAPSHRTARKVLLIVLVTYLALGLVVALVWMPGTYLCPGYHGPSGFTTMDKSCHHIASSGDRLRFIGKIAPTWPQTLIQDGIAPPPVFPKVLDPAWLWQHARPPAGHTLGG